jgi:chromate reductase, NAD(P)H dehydrogenase (quinone)
VADSAVVGENTDRHRDYETNGYVRVLAINGSLRADSLNRGLLEAAGELAPADVAIQTVDLAELPLYNSDFDEEIGGHDTPFEVQSLKRQIAESDALLISTPEYNWSVSGVLKNAIDWASRPAGRSVLAGKPTALVGASPGPAGTGRAQLHMREILLSTKTPVLMSSVQAGFARDRFDNNGQLVDDDLRSQIQGLLENLAIEARSQVTAGYQYRGS